MYWGSGCLRKTGNIPVFGQQVQVNLDMTDSMGPGKLVRHMQNPLYTYDEYLICIGLGPSISSVICKNPSYSGPSYPSSPVIQCVYLMGKRGLCMLSHSFSYLQLEQTLHALWVINNTKMGQSHPYKYNYIHIIQLSTN